MTPPAAPAVRRVVLVPVASGSRPDELVRRYRLARLRMDPPPPRPAPKPAT